MKNINGEIKHFQSCLQVSDPKHVYTPAEIIPAPVRGLPDLAVCQCGKVVRFRNGRMVVHGRWI